MMTFDDFQPGASLGACDFTFTNDAAAEWSALFPDDSGSLPVMPPGVAVTDVSDRGSDLTEYIAYEIQAQRTFIVRSQHNRKLVEDEDETEVLKLHDRLRLLLELEDVENGRRK